MIAPALPPSRGPAPREPRYTIYVDSWAEARACAAALPGRLRRVFGAVLDYMEEGWSILRSVALAAEDAYGNGALHASEKEFVCTFIEAELVDLYRSVAFGRRDRIPGFLSRFGHCSGDYDAVSEAEELQRYFHVLALGACDPRCPATVRAVVGPAVRAYDLWLAGLPRVMAPVYALRYAGGSRHAAAPLGVGTAPGLGRHASAPPDAGRISGPPSYEPAGRQRWGLRAEPLLLPAFTCAAHHARVISA